MQSVISPIVSVIIPVYNGEKFLSEAIESVLNQTYRNFECLVINDGSTDHSGEIAQSFGKEVRYFEKTNGGVCSARNLGIANGKGRFMAFLDADDIWLPEKLEKQLQLFEKEENLGLVFCGSKVVNENKELLGQHTPTNKEELLERILCLKPNTGAISTTGVVPRTVFQTVGYFDEQLSTSADADMVCRIALEYEFDAVDEPLALYRQHGDQMHNNLDAFEHDSKIIFDKVFNSKEPLAIVSKLRSEAYSSLESTLAIAYFRRKAYSKTIKHLLSALFLNPPAFIRKMFLIIRNRRHSSATPNFS